MNKYRQWKRVWVIAQGAIQGISPSLFSFLISWLVIHMQNASLWGEFVKVQVWVMIVVQVFAFGNKEYLLRSFSQTPAKMEYNWTRSFFSRSIFLFLLSMLFLMLPIDMKLKGWILAWCIIRFVYQSFDVVILYKKRFLLSMTAELLGLLLLFVALYKPIHNPVLGQLLKVYVIADLIKAVFMLVVYHGLFKFSFFDHFNLGYFKGAFMFFLLTVTGFIASKADQLSVNHFMKPEMIARYQVFASMMGFMQFGASLLLAPFIKNIYRLKIHVIQKLEKKYFTAGAVMAVANIAFLFIIVNFVFHFSYSVWMYLLAYLYILSFYFYFVKMILLTKIKRQQWVVLTMIICSSANLCLSVFLTPEFGLEGALVSATLAQWIIVIFLRMALEKFVYKEMKAHGKHHYANI